MIRNVPAAVLSLGMLASAISLAQSATTESAPPPPDHHAAMERGRLGPGRPGPGGPAGLHMMMGRAPAPVPNSPFSATFTSTASMKNREGAQVERSSTRTVYRDSLGRTREDVTLPPPPPRVPRSDAAANGTAPPPPVPPQTAPRVVSVIFDPVANTITRLNAERKIAFVQTVRPEFFHHAQTRQDGPPEGREQRERPGATVTDLGSKTIAGVVAQGKRISHTMPGPDGQAERTMTRETWFSPDLKLQVSETDSAPRGTRSEAVTSLTKAEPAASLFKVPEGYAIKQAPDRAFPGRGPREHGGHEGSPFDGPPPAM